MSPSEDPVSFVNVFEIDREDVDAFLAVWQRLADVMASAPGFRDAQLHRAVSGETRFQLVNVAYWDSERAWREAAARPEMQAAMQAVGADPSWAAAVHNPGLYRPAVSFAS